MRIGIIFGGQSREREISFAGGRTVYDNLNKTFFTPIPIFVDSLGNFIELKWENLYKGTIRDFYPATGFLPKSPHFFQVYAESIENDVSITGSINEIGQKIQPEELKERIDFAFLTLHGPFGEDGNIQGILEWYGIPYSGAGILPSSIGIDKEIQKTVLKTAGFTLPNHIRINRSDWETNTEICLSEILKQLTFPLVVKAPHQGSSIGVSIVHFEKDLKLAIERSLFIQKFQLSEWKNYSEEEKRTFLVRFTDIREGLGFPVFVNQDLLFHPEDLWKYLNESQEEWVELVSPNGESAVIIEEFIRGKEFSCIVIEDPQGNPIALPPTEIRKTNDVFDYRSKYLPGISRKITPIELPAEAIRKIMQSAERLFVALHSQVYARLDGFYDENGLIYLNDPNTTSGMLPSSFFFHQAAEIGLNPSQFLTYIISKSIDCRMSSGKNIFSLMDLNSRLKDLIRKAAAHQEEKIKVAVIMGGFSSERHISVESGRNIYEKLASSVKYRPIPIFLTGDEQRHELYQLPINVLLKDNADDIRDKVLKGNPTHPVVAEIRDKSRTIIEDFASESALELEKLTYVQLAERVDFAFIALHGRPGEDGAVQIELEKHQLPYNGSGSDSSSLTINKYLTNQRLRDHGILVADHALVLQEAYVKDPAATVFSIIDQFGLPLIAKPADDGCSSAVKKIKTAEELEAFCEMMFRPTAEFPEGPRQKLKLKYNEEFPQKTSFLVETLIGPDEAYKFMEITGGLLTRYNHKGKLEYDVFEPSEVLASGEILSLEEKFLAGEGQNITPARFASTQKEYEEISKSVKSTLKKVAKIVEVEGYCRIDAFVRIYPEKIETIVIEINSLPGMTPATAIFHQAAIQGMKPYDFIDEIISFGIQRSKMKND